ncbi:MAG: Crp/Fnr family transcriptional regulator [Deltaproteobacteria bacterium]|nr:Crp/Fnr family transcriptional regulator [Deltaproteobacteria bacterium]MBI3387207.1 Crp/Fnr family transcriptional regulator [Deltaproteobacteria bacterium]
MSHPLGTAGDPKVRARIAIESGLDRATVDALLSAATIRYFARGTSVYPQGTHRGSIFVVLSGAVSVSIGLPRGTRILCAFYQPGAMFGFPIVETERPRLSAANAFTTATLAVVPRREFERLIGGLAPPLVLRFFNRVLERQARFAMRLVHCVALDLRGRLALTILDLAASFGVPEPNGVRVQLPITHVNLAEMVGASRERVSKGMAALMADGLISYARQAITVLDVKRLERLMADG